MSSKCYVDTFDSKQCIYARYTRPGIVNDIVELLERLNNNSEIWAVRCVETGEIILAQESDLENPYYWGE